ncbi:hypothetical protein AAJ76_367000328 [Vairimorpha ceranae]|uniref:Uncharacterized protein n=1 Tax=Vairimorpha ceranae TaxID=40302 RepID=A0A0F9WKF5_9MICR|nr:hypothetical protein AAJ76_367000328 [Vairimorpha ceranae]KKO73628.1 hypothetical protein AAJ76_367000328 [Vairimorpha ceranae]
MLTDALLRHADQRRAQRRGSKMGTLNIEFVKNLSGMYCWVCDYALARPTDFCDC